MFRSESVSKKMKDKKYMKNKIKTKNRKRDKVVCFRLTQTESDMLDRKITLTGTSKQEYIIQSIFNHEVNIKSDYRLAESISMEIFQLAKVIKKFGKLNDEEQLLLMYILEIYEEIKNEKASSNWLKAR